MRGCNENFIHYEETVTRGVLPSDLLDMPNYGTPEVFELLWAGFLLM